MYKCLDKKGNYFNVTISKLKDGSSVLVDTEDILIKEKNIDNIIYDYIERNGIIHIYYVKNNILYNIETNISLEKAFEEVKKIE